MIEGFKMFNDISGFFFVLSLSFLTLSLFFNFILIKKIKLCKDDDKIKYNSEEINILNKNNITPREQEVLKLWIDGKSRDEIEEMLFISYHTVKNHIQNIYKKLKVRNRGELLLKVKYNVKRVD